jgi:hypothetical protein
VAPRRQSTSASWCSATVCSRARPDATAVDGAVDERSCRVALRHGANPIVVACRSLCRMSGAACHCGMSNRAMSSCAVSKPVVARCVAALCSRVLCPAVCVSLFSFVCVCVCACACVRACTACSRSLSSACVFIALRCRVCCAVMRCMAPQSCEWQRTECGGGAARPHASPRRATLRPATAALSGGPRHPSPGPGHHGAHHEAAM